MLPRARCACRFPLLLLAEIGRAPVPNLDTAVVIGASTEVVLPAVAFNATARADAAVGCPTPRHRHNETFAVAPFCLHQTCGHTGFVRPSTEAMVCTVSPNFVFDLSILQMGSSEACMSLSINFSPVRTPERGCRILTDRNVLSKCQSGRSAHLRQDHNAAVRLRSATTGAAAIPLVIADAVCGAVDLLRSRGLQMASDPWLVAFLDHRLGERVCSG